MKKKEKKLNNLVLVCICTMLVLFITTLYITNYETNNYAKSKNEIAFASYDDLLISTEFQEEINKINKETFGENYSEILSKNNISTNIAKEIDEKFKSDNIIIYPNYYGGMYINSDGELIIQVTKDDNLNKTKTDNKYNSYINSVDSKNIKYVENSYNALEKINNEIIAYFTNNGEKINGFIGNYIDVYSNHVIVELKNNSIEEQNEFKEKVINSELITFVKSEEKSLTASYNAGAKYTFSYSKTEGNTIKFYTNSCSIGYRAKRKGVSGFVTAGHCFYGINASLSIGTIQKSFYNQTMDAAFVAIGSGNSITNNLNVTNYMTQSLNTSNAGYITTGTMVGKVGASSGYQSGTVQSTNYSTTSDDGIYHTNMIKASNYNIDGDSGGPVFKIGTSTNPVGTVIGVTSLGPIGGGNMTAFYNADSIATALGITRY